jgi:putative ABC transport system permease protein
VVQVAELRKSWFIGVKALRRNALQTTLTMLGMSIGVATLLTTIALGAGAQAAIETQVRAAGMNVIVVSAGNYKLEQQWTNSGEVSEPAAYEPERAPAQRKTAVWDGVGGRLLRRVQQGGDRDDPTRRLAKGPENIAGRGGADTLSLADADEVAKLSGVQHVSGGVAENGTVKSGDTTWFTKVRGEQASLTGIRRAWVFPHGSFFTKAEVDRGDAVVVLGSIASEKLFGARNPVGEQGTLKGRVFRVKGVMASGVWMVRAAPGDGEFDAVYVPVTAAMQLRERKNLDTLTISTESTGDVTRVTKAVTGLLRQRHGLGSSEPDDFVVASEAHKSLARGGMRTDVTRAVTSNVGNLDKVTLDQLGKTLEKASRTMTALLGSIAVVSLVVGGIGIMNIMLLSVTERTREIGIRRAVGALSREVMLQFLMEAMTLSLTGGLLGIVGGVIAAGLITKVLQWSTSVSPLVVLTSFTISAAIGVGFGYYPARQAARVSPMNSLRYE